eukprot:1937951-Prymnesium_polylepis.1
MAQRARLFGATGGSIAAAHARESRSLPSVASMLGAAPMPPRVPQVRLRHHGVPERCCRMEARRVDSPAAE